MIKMKKDAVPLLSVVTVVPGVGKTDVCEKLQRCIASVLTQDYPRIEHLVVNGSSDKGVIALLRDYERAGCIRVFSISGEGWEAAKDVGLLRANGKYITYLNAEDAFGDAQTVTDAMAAPRRHFPTFVRTKSLRALKTECGENDRTDGKAKAFLKRLLPYGIMYLRHSDCNGAAVDMPLFFYPGFGKRLRRIVKFSLPYGIVMAVRRLSFCPAALDSILTSADTGPKGGNMPVCDGEDRDLPSLPQRSELAPYVRFRCSGGDSDVSHPDVTVVTVVFNAVKVGRAAQFKQCLDSVQSQEDVAIEHLIIDGASSDGTLELLDGYKPSRHQVCVFSHPDKGIYDAMNRGLALASGRYVTFLNSDDFYSDPRGLHDSVARLDESKAEFSYAPIIVLDAGGKPMDHPNCHPDVRRIYFAMAFCHQSVVVRTDAFRAIRGFDVSYRSAADYDSVLRMIFFGYHAVKVERVYVTFRTGGFSWTNMEASQRECGLMFSRLYGKHLQYRITPEEGYLMYITQHGPLELEEKALKCVDEAFGLAQEREKPRTSVSFRDRGNVLGLYAAENWGAWTGKEMRIRIRVGNELRGKDLLLSFYLGSCPNGRDVAMVEVWCNGHALSGFKVENFMPARHDVRCPADFVCGEEIVLDLSSSHVFRSETDPRELGLSFERVDFKVVSGTIEEVRDEE